MKNLWYQLRQRIHFGLVCQRCFHYRANHQWTSKSTPCSMCDCFKFSLRSPR